MKPLHSFRVRIFLAVLLLELVMLALVIGPARQHAMSQAQRQIAEQDRLVLDLLEEAARAALTASEPAGLVHLFRRAARHPHIVAIELVASDGRTVASSHPGAFRASAPDTYRHARPVEAGGRRAELAVAFSERELRTAFRGALSLGVGIAAAAMTAVAVAGLLFGILLTRRLNRLIEQTRRFSEGDLDARVSSEGGDELAELGAAFNDMAGRIGTQLERIRHLASHDPLTGLANRTVFHERLRAAVASARESGRHHVLLYLDLDQFKIVNDTCGHEAGDTLLTDITRLIAQTTRARDTVARLGGDEFGILVEHGDLEEGRALADRILEAVRGFRFHCRGHAFRIGVSIGVVPIDGREADTARVLALADMACYTAKDKGRDTLHLVRDDDPETLRRSRQMVWTARLQEAMEQHQFVVHCQAIARAHDPRERPFAEFLLRLRAPDDTLIAPDRFIPAAEQYHLMPALDRHVLTLVFESMRECTPDTRPGTAFINLSGQSLGDDRLADFIERHLRRFDLPAEWFCFEITETAAVQDLRRAARFIERMRALGARVALDDFGSGMSSFAYLKHLAADFVKIDGGFVRGLAHDPTDRRIVSAIHEVARHMGFVTIAESVEDRRTLDTLAALGIDFVQGHVIERPHPPCRAHRAREPHPSSGA